MTFEHIGIDNTDYFEPEKRLLTEIHKQYHEPLLVQSGIAGKAWDIYCDQFLPDDMLPEHPNEELYISMNSMAVCLYALGKGNQKGQKVPAIRISIGQVKTGGMPKSSEATVGMISSDGDIISLAGAFTWEDVEFVWGLLHGKKGLREQGWLPHLKPDLSDIEGGN